MRTANNAKLPVESIEKALEEKLDDQEIFRQVEVLYGNPAELKKLVQYAHSYIQLYQSLPEDYDAEDIVFTVIEKNLDGSRGQSFDPSKGAFSAWLKRQIKWEIKTKSRWERGKSETPIPVDEQGDYHEEMLHHWAQGDRITPSLQPDNPEWIVISEAEAEAWWDYLYEIIDGDDDLEKIVEALENGCDMKPRKLAKELGWNVDRVYNAKKRLKRRLLRRAE